MGSLKGLFRTSYSSSIETIALDCLVFEKIAFLCTQLGDRWRDGWTDKQMDSTNT